MKVFISHAKEDGPIAAQWKDLLTNLTSDFIEVWFFSDVSRDGGVPGGVEWRNALVAELKQSSAIIAIITPQGKYSPWIYWECGVAVGTDHQRLVFPICYKMAISDAPGPLNGYQVFNGCDEIDVKRVCQEILRIDNKDPKEKTLQPLIKDYLSNIDKILIGHRILSYEPHKGYVNDVDWVGNESGSFVSVSDDATIKITPFRDVGLSNSVVVCEINRIKCGCYIRELGGLIYGMLPGEVKYLALTPPYDAMVILYQHPAVRTIAFDKSGKCIATGGYNKELCIYKLDLSNLSVKELIRTPCQGNVCSVAWSHDNSFLAYSEGSLVTVLQFAPSGLKQKLSLPGHSSDVLSISWSRDESHIVSGDRDGNMIIWNSISGKHKHWFNRFATVGSIRAVTFHPQSLETIAVGGTRGTVEIFTFENNESSIRTVKLGDSPMFVNQIRWNPKGDMILAACGDTVKVLSVA